MSYDMAAVVTIESTSQSYDLRLRFAVEMSKIKIITDLIELLTRAFHKFLRKGEISIIIEITLFMYQNSIITKSGITST